MHPFKAISEDKNVPEKINLSMQQSEEVSGFRKANLRILEIGSKILDIFKQYASKKYFQENKTFQEESKSFSGISREDADLNNKYLDILSKLNFREMNKNIEKRKEFCQEGFYNCCSKCFETSRRTTLLLCGHWICKWCMRDKITNCNSKSILITCPVDDCFNLLSIEDIKQATILFPYEEEKIKEIKNNKNYCLLCGESYTRLNFVEIQHDPLHSLCKQCLVKYCEYKTNGEILIKSDSGYLPIQCFFPNCSQTIPAEAILSCCDPAEQKRMEIYADSQQQNNDKN